MKLRANCLQWIFSSHSKLNYSILSIEFSEPKACGRPEQPPNSTMIAPKGFDVDAVIEYGCDDGHLLVGPAKRSCMDTGFYNEFPPVCKCKGIMERNYIHYFSFQFLISI